MSLDDTRSIPLKDFISGTLLEIVTGVEQAREAIKTIDTNAEICPTGLYFAPGHPPGPFKPGRGFVQEVSFKVAVTVSQAQTAEGAGQAQLKLGVPVLEWLGGVEASADASLARELERSSVQHVEFKVPVLLPSELHVWRDKAQQPAKEPD
jgi:hypothetical protein